MGLFVDVPNNNRHSKPEEKIEPSGLLRTVFNGLSSQEIESRFGFHKATIEGSGATAPKHSTLRRLFVDFAEQLTLQVEYGREAALAMTALEEASMWAHKAIAKTDPIVQEKN